MKKISIETVASGVCITGDISAVLSNRRASRLLKDTLDCEILESKIMIKNVVDLNHCLNRINQIAQLCGCQVYYSDKTDEAVDRFLEEEQKFAEFSEKALSIRNNECNLQDLHEFKDALIEFCLPGHFMIYNFCQLIIWLFLKMRVTFRFLGREKQV